MTRKEINTAKSALRQFVRSMLTFSIPGCGLGLTVEYNDGHSANFWSLHQVEEKVAEMQARQDAYALSVGEVA